MGRTKATDEQIVEAAKKIGVNIFKTSMVDVRNLAAELQMSDTNVWYRLRQLRNAEKVEPAQKLQATANREDNQAEKITEVINTTVDFADLIPEKNPDYQERPVDKIIEKYSERTVPVLLIGEAGVGKTEAIRQLAAKKKLPFLRIACDDSAILKEFIGRRELVNGNTIFRTGLLIELLQVPSVILFDEFNALPPAKLFFLHELLDNRRIFIKDAEEGIVINAHPQAKIFLACNPNSARYIGTNKINVALVDRCAVVNLPELSPEDFAEFFNCNSVKTTNALKQFYCQVKRVISEQNLRVAFSIRAVKRISEAIRNGDEVAEALAYGFYNSAYATASDKERNAIEQIAKVCFGLNAYNE